ncbi:hypothetical protein KUCAC02_006838 [Chaenocephalus aceratus]|uniref:Uncharacterized protein n=1 Tax=Chaenocephalus aceratus TaxID=36190 RepID=A0ACB9VUE1_CHAAC|nr:hypothetical protein KUCAC02_006838 [Chaenocephalus aceratus]
MKIFSVAHKTVFVVDHCPYMAESSRQQHGVLPDPLRRLPLHKLINYVVSDSEFHILNTWRQEDQSTHELMSALAAVGPPNPREDPECCSILHGLVAAVESLCKITELQHERRTDMMDTAERVANRGRIICLTNAKSDTHVRMLEDCIQETILEQNRLAAGSDRLMAIQQCDLVLVHIHPQGEEPLVYDRPKKEISSLLTSEVHSQHYDLASTTITNIPMKPTLNVCEQEEQHANTSANYDVELLHHRDAHMEFFKSGDLHMAGSSTRENGLKETITLKWCTPRTNSIELHYCTGAYRISPTDVNSRPSSCLTNFPSTVARNRSTLEDPPSISEGCGGRVTDYRITDFGEFMRENRLTPVSETSHDPSGKLPAERAKSQLERHTRYWPMIISQTTIFNMQAVVPLANLIVKETCLKKTDEQYRIMWNELETLVKTHAGATDRHQRVLDCIVACRSKPPEEEEKEKKKRGRKREDKEDKTEKNGSKDADDKSWQESERLKGLLDKEEPESEVIKDSPDSPEPANKKPRLSIEEVPPPERAKGPVSLLTMWSNRITAANSRKHQEFMGRVSSVNNKFELYQQLKEENGMDVHENGKSSR